MHPDKNVAWARDFGKALQKFAGGACVNDLSYDDATGSVARTERTTSGWRR